MWWSTVAALTLRRWNDWFQCPMGRHTPPFQEKCLVVNKHQTRARKCWVLLHRCQLRWLLWQVTIILLVTSINSVPPNDLFHHCVTYIESVPAWSYFIKMDCKMSTTDGRQLENHPIYRALTSFCSKCYWSDDLEMQLKVSAGFCLFVREI